MSFPWQLNPEVGQGGVSQQRVAPVADTSGGGLTHIIDSIAGHELRVRVLCNTRGRRLVRPLTAWPTVHSPHDQQSTHRMTDSPLTA